MSALDAIPRTVAWLIKGDERYGPRQGTIALLTTLRLRGWRTPIVTVTDGDFARECRDLGFETVGLGMGPAPVLDGSLLSKTVRFTKQVMFERRAVNRLVRLLEGFEAQAVYVRWPNIATLAGRASHRLQIPCFWHTPNALGRYPLHLNRLLVQQRSARYGMHLLANSTYTAGTFGQSPVKPSVLYLAVDPKRFDPDGVEAVSRERLQIPPEAVVFGIVGRVDADKCQDRLLDALLELGPHEPPLHLLLVGGATDRVTEDALRAAASAAGASDRLHMTGAVADPQRYYPCIDVAVNCRLGPEPFGISVIESMAMRCPVLARAFGGPAETVLDDVCGWHIRDPSVATLSAGVRRALADRHRWPQMGAAARRRVLEHFTFEHMADRFAEIFEQARSRSC